MAQKITRNSIIIGILIFSTYLLVALITINDYGVTWDLPYEEISGRTILNYYKDPFKSKDSVITAIKNNFYMPIKFSAIISDESHDYLFKKKLLKEDSAYHFPIIIISSFTISIIYFFVLQEAGLMQKTYQYL